MIAKFSFFEHDLPACCAIIVPVDYWQPITAEIARAVHPADFWQGGDPDTLLPIAQVRALRHFASSHPVGSQKVACLWAADRYKLETSNALLKLLEEPPVYLTLVLLAETDHFLPTVRSRVQIVAATLDSAIIKEGGWFELLTRFNLEKREERARAQHLLYLHSLVHPGIKSESILESFGYRQKYL